MKDNKSLALAYNMKRKSKKMAMGGMAEKTGEPMVPMRKPDDKRLSKEDYMSGQWSGGQAPARKPDDRRLPEDEYMAQHFVDGGIVNQQDEDSNKQSSKRLSISNSQNLAPPQDDAAAREAAYQEKLKKMAMGGQIGGMSDDARASSIAEAIMRKRKAKMMAEGGMVDLDENAREDQENNMDQMNHEAAMKEIYDDSEISAQPEDSNEHGDDITADEHDMISKIRAKMRAKRGA